MLDIQLLRTQPEIVAAGLAKRGAAIDLAPFETLEAQRKQVQIQTLSPTKAKKTLPPLQRWWILVKLVKT